MNTFVMHFKTRIYSRDKKEIAQKTTVNWARHDPTLCSHVFESPKSGIHKFVVLYSSTIHEFFFYIIIILLIIRMIKVKFKIYE
jgi:hypothetical protein